MGDGLWLSLSRIRVLKMLMMHVYVADPCTVAFLNTKKKQNASNLERKVVIISPNEGQAL